MLTPLSMAMPLLLLTILGGVVGGLLLREHWQKILVSLVFGAFIGLLWRYCWRQVRERSPEIVEQMRRNAAEAQEVLRDSFAWKLGAGRPVSFTASSLSVEEVLSDFLSIVLSVSLAGMVWVLPVFWEPWNAGLVALAKAAGAQFFALCCIATATFGVMARLAGRAGGAL
jgi:ABC-type transport system involved in cytochrome bd biosynthesis fused ATPase/permease subunit